MDLTKIPAKALHAELARRAEEEAKERERKEQEQRALWFANIDAYLALVEHTNRPTEHTDRDHWSYHFECPRCALVTAKETKEWPDDLRITVVVERF